MTKVTNEINDLFRKVKSILGEPIRSVELTDDQLCNALDFCVGDYSEKINNWTIEVNWAQLYGRSGLTNNDIALALATRSFDMMKDYSYWFSKQVGLQQEGPWELKKDFITIEKGKQVYVVPSGRTINKVMYVNPPVTQAALFANYAGIDIGFGGGYAQIGGGAYGPVGGFYTAPAADIAYLATDLTYKNRLLRSDLTYKVTAGPDGTHLIHLLSTPGSRLSFNHFGGIGGYLGLIGCEVWYTYYDTKTQEEADECARAHNGQVILSPDQVTMENMDFAFLNEPAKVVVRQLLVAKAKEMLGLIRGKFEGKISIPQAEARMDYQMLIQQGKEEYDRTMKNLDERLQRMRPSAVMEEQQKLMQATLELKKHVPISIVYAI